MSVNRLVCINIEYSIAWVINEIFEYMLCLENKYLFRSNQVWNKYYTNHKQILHNCYHYISQFEYTLQLFIFHNANTLYSQLYFTIRIHFTVSYISQFEYTLQLVIFHNSNTLYSYLYFTIRIHFTFSYISQFEYTLHLVIFHNANTFLQSVIFHNSNTLYS